jgi:hypothetical protein
MRKAHDEGAKAAVLTVYGWPLVVSFDIDTDFVCVYVLHPRPCVFFGSTCAFFFFFVAY